MARDVTHGGGSVPPPPATAAVEIRDLYEDFGRMAEAVDRRSRYLRDFAAAVSHEFKTPLAGIQGAVELLQDHGDDMEAEQRRRFLGNIDADARRLSDLVTRLLDLARADMARPEAGAAVDVRSVAARIADALKGGLTIVIDLPADLPQVAVPHAGDQQPQAGRITQAGVGYGVQPANFTLASARWFARQLLASDALRQTAAAWQAELAALGGVAATAEQIERELDSR